MRKIKTLWAEMKRCKVAYMMLAPFLILFMVFTVIPVGMSILLSFTHYNMLEAPVFAGLDNYRKLFLNDEVFGIAVRNTLIIAIVTGPLSYAACFLLAWLINDLKRGVRTFLTVVFYAPSISGGVYMIWQVILSSDRYGFLNNLLISLGIIDDPVFWTQDSSTVLGVVLVVSVWLSLGTSFLAFIAGLQGVDSNLYEAAAMDGVTNRFQELWYITLPCMKPQLMFGAVMQITASFGVGDLSANLVGFPSVDYAAHTVVNHIQDYGHIRFQMGYASAIATLLFLAMMITNKIVQGLLRKVGN